MKFEETKRDEDVNVVTAKSATLNETGNHTGVNNDDDDDNNNNYTLAGNAVEVPADYARHQERMTE